MEAYDSIEAVVAEMLKTADSYGLGYEVLADYDRFVEQDGAKSIQEHIRCAVDALDEWDI